MYITLSQTQLTTFQCNPTTARTATVSNQSLDENCSHHIHTVRSLPGFYKVTQDLERKSQFLNNPHQQLVPEKKVLEGTVSQK